MWWLTKQVMLSSNLVQSKAMSSKLRINFIVTVACMNTCVYCTLDIFSVLSSSFMLNSLKYMVVNQTKSIK